MGLGSRVRKWLEKPKKPPATESDRITRPTTPARDPSPATHAPDVAAVPVECPVATVIAHPSPEEHGSFVPRLGDGDPSALGPASPATASRTSASALGALTAASASPRLDPWARALEILQNREPVLLADYERHLASLQSDVVVDIDISAPRDIKSLVAQLMDDREKKQWRVPLLHTDIKIREQVEKLTKFLIWSDPIVKNAVSAQPYAALAWSGVSLLLPLLTSATTQNEAMLTGFNSLGHVQVYWNICEKAYLESPEQEAYQALIEPLAGLYSYIIEYQACVICHLSRAQLSRAWQDIAGWNAWEAKATKIKDLNDQCSAYIPHLKEEEIRGRWSEQLQTMQQSQEILNQIRQTLEEGGRQTRKLFEDHEEKNLLQDLASDYEGYRSFNPQRVEGTCEWFFNDERFLSWRDSSTPGLLWVSGGPGCGKSVLSRALVDEHRLTTNVTTSIICHFFFKDGDEGRMHAPDALSAILHQIFTQDPSGSLIKKGLNSHRNYGKALSRNFHELWQVLMECARSPEIGEIVCILDALDECKKDSRRRLVEQLRDFYKDQNKEPSPFSKLKFLITSRPYDDLEDSFKTFSNIPTFSHLNSDDNSDEISQEINLVIDARVHTIASDFVDQDRSTIIQRLESVEHRTYLWLHLTFDIIEQSPSRFARLQDVTELLSTLPAQVFDAYDKILSRSQDSQRTKVLLQILLAAVRPLSLDEANVALVLALEKPRPKTYSALQSQLWPKHRFRSIVTNLCGLFISVHDSKLFFIHQTAKEFLTHPERQSKWGGRFTMQESHSTMSAACLNYLLLSDLAQAQNSPDDQSISFPYAADHWSLHYASQEQVNAEQSRKDALLLCNVTGKQARLWMPQFFAKQNSVNWESWSDLVLASYLGNMMIAQDILLRDCAQGTTEARYGGNALHMASRKGHQEIVQLLLDKGVDVNARWEEDNASEYCMASYQSQRGTVQLLLDNTADSDSEWERKDTTALCMAAYQGHLGIVQLLLDNGADIDEGGQNNPTALWVASFQGHEEVVQLLIDKGADVNARWKEDEWTALFLASYRCHTGVVQLLLSKSANYKEVSDDENSDPSQPNGAAQNGMILCKTHTHRKFCADGTGGEF